MNIFGLRYFGIFFLIISFFSFFNIIYSYYFNLLSNLDNYILTFILTLISGVFLIIFKKYKYEKINLFERILIVFIGYLTLPVLISIPYYLSLEDIGLINCYFEAISGFTSTGFTIFQEIQELDQTLILWRSSSQWIGGLYFLFSILLLIDLFDENLKRSLTNYIALNSSEIFKQVFKIIIIYLSMTIFIFVLLKIVNLRSYEAYNYSLSIISSGGFLPNDNFDLTFITDIEGQYFYGLNMHYLPPMRRAILMDNLYKNLVNETEATARVRISYSILKKAASMPGWKACFKKYIKRRVRGRFMMVDPNNWDIAVQLPLARFQKASINRVYGDSRKLI